MGIYKLTIISILRLSVATFQIPNSHFVNGNNDVNLLFSVMCSGELKTIQHRFSLRLNLPPPPSFRVSNVGASSSSGLGPGQVSISYTVDGDVVAFSVSIVGEVIFLYGYTLNGATDIEYVG